MGPTQNVSSDCHLSFVVTTRNDNHGGDMLRRFQIFAETLLEQANRHSLAGELIVVEWNPPAGPRLHGADWPGDRLLARPAACGHADLQHIGHAVSCLPWFRRWFDRRTFVAGDCPLRDPNRVPHP